MYSCDCASSVPIAEARDFTALSIFPVDSPEIALTAWVSSTDDPPRIPETSSRNDSIVLVVNSGLYGSDSS